MPICNLPCALSVHRSLRRAPCALLCALLLYHEASLFSQSAFVCLMLLFTSMQLKFFNIASVNTQALLHPLLLLLPRPGVCLLLSSYLRVVAFRPQKPVYRALQPVAGRQTEAAAAASGGLSHQLSDGKSLYGSHDFMSSICTVWHNDIQYPWKFIEREL